MSSRAIKGLTLIVLIALASLCGCSPAVRETDPDDSPEGEGSQSGETHPALVLEHLGQRIEDLGGIHTIEYLDLVGERTVVRDSDSIEEVTGWILQAEYESDCFPERDTGGGILGKMVLTGEDTLEISVHFDFLWVDNTTYALDEETVVEMNRFLREPR